MVFFSQKKKSPIFMDLVGIKRIETWIHHKWSHMVIQTQKVSFQFEQRKLQPAKKE